jgi:hypothetical protein
VRKKNSIMEMERRNKIEWIKKYQYIIEKNPFFANNTGKNLQNIYFLYNPPIRPETNPLSSKL